MANPLDWPWILFGVAFVFMFPIINWWRARRRKGKGGTERGKG